MSRPDLPLTHCDLAGTLCAGSRQGGGAREQLRQRITATGGAGFADAADFVVSLLDEREPQRLGCGRAGFQSLQGHRWFRGFDWLQLLALEMPPPYVPRDIENRAPPYPPLAPTQPDTITGPPTPSTAPLFVAIPPP